MKIRQISSFYGSAIALAVLFFGSAPVHRLGATSASSRQSPGTYNQSAAAVRRAARPASGIHFDGNQPGRSTGISLGIPAKIVIPAEDKNGTDNGKVKVRIEVPADTPLGFYPFRYATLKGVSNLRLLAVDDLPQFVSNGANRSKATAQAVKTPGTIAGAVAAESGDYYKINVPAGQRLSFDCLATGWGA